MYETKTLKTKATETQFKALKNLNKPILKRQMKPLINHWPKPAWTGNLTPFIYKTLAELYRCW